MERLNIKPVIILIAIALFFLVSCFASRTVTGGNVLILTHGRLVDGNGGEPIKDGMVVIEGEKIKYAGEYDKKLLVKDAEVVDLTDMTILPGFINAHVHNAYDEDNLSAWAMSGITTVRDEGIIFGAQWKQKLAARSKLDKPEFARIVSACPMLGLEGGYCNYIIDDADDAVKMVNTFIDAGFEIIKISRENGIEGRTDMTLLPEEIYTAVIRAAHDRGIPVSAHITKETFLKDMLDANVDDIAHICFDKIYSEDIETMVKKDIYLVPTLTVYNHYGGLTGASDNLFKLVEGGVHVAMGNDYADIMAQYGFEMGMPVKELLMMEGAGLSSMQVIVASTKNSAKVCNIEDVTGTLEQGKRADIICVPGNPLEDLRLMGDVCLVIKDGVIIKSSIH